jgi:hypothetical protein
MAVTTAKAPETRAIRSRAGDVLIRRFSGEALEEA